MSFTLLPADLTYDKILPALLNKLEMKFTSDNVSEFISFGELFDATITGTPTAAKISGNRQKQLLVKYEIKCNLKTTGANMRTNLALIMSNAVDVRLTDINGNKWTFTSAQALPTFGEEIKGDGEEAVMYPITIGGIVTAAQWGTIYS